jgi:hypothetical protein
LLLDFLIYGTIPVVIYYALLYGWKQLRRRSPDIDVPPRTIALPLMNGTWQAFNSPATKVPSHGTDWLAQRYAIDIVGYDLEVEGYTRKKDWRAKVWLEPPARFVGFGESIVVPEAATVVSAYDGIGDRLACRSWPGLIWFTISSVSLILIALVWRSPAGLASVTGNHVILRLHDGTCLGLMHLRRGSLKVEEGDVLAAGDVIGEVGNTGNTTQPHLHVQLMDGPDIYKAKPIPLRFAGLEVRVDSHWQTETEVMPANLQVFRPIDA